MAEDHPRRRWFHLQFSLRSLLAFMLLIGAGIAVYRWPWEVTQEIELETLAFGSYYINDGKSSPGDVGKLVTTYHRDWPGQPVKHGPERIFVQGVLVEEKWFGDGVLHGRARCFNDAGEILEERTYHNGVQQGPCRIGDGKTWVVTGDYDRAVKDGAWTVLADRQQGDPEAWLTVLNQEFRFSTRPRHQLELPADPIVVHQSWQRGKRHGRWEWRTTRGELLNSAQYENDRLKVWNDFDVPENYWLWLAEHDSELWERLKEPAESLVQDPPYFTNSQTKTNDLGTDVSLFEATFSRTVSVPLSHRVIHYALPLDSRPFRLPEASIGDNLLEHALLHGLAPDFRYGGLWFVPADEVTGCHDATGVDQVTFAAGSPQAREWEDAVDVNLGAWNKMLSNRPSQLLYFPRSIVLDLSAVTDEHLQPNYLGINFKRRRRDALALTLYRSGLQCEQRGNTLVIKPHWTQTKIEKK